MFKTDYNGTIIVIESPKYVLALIIRLRHIHHAQI